MQSTPIPAARQPQDDHSTTTGLTDHQTRELLKPIDPLRVFVAQDGTRRLRHQDVRRRLSQIFGFTGWAEEIISTTCIEERKEERTGLMVLTYSAHVRVHIRDGRGGSLTFFDGIGVWDGTQRKLRPGFTETVVQARHNVANGAASVAFLRAVLSLGDQFGLSLHLDVPPTHGYVRYTLTLPESIPAPEPMIVAEPPQPSAEAAAEADDEPNAPAYDDEFHNTPEDTTEEAMAG